LAAVKEIRVNTSRRATLLAALAVGATVTTVPVWAAEASRSPFGTSAAGETVEIITLKNKGGMIVRFSTRGGAILEIGAPDRKGARNNVVLGHPDFAAWEKAGSFNTVVGRFANRIGGGGFTLDDVFYKLAGANPNNVVLHGGPGGFASRLFMTETFESPTAAGATMTYVSADGENGFPGELTLEMTYTLTEESVLRLDYVATTTKPTVVNLTNHTYFNIGGYDSGPVYDQVMQVFASRLTPTDAHQVPTGEIATVEGTPFDFRKPTRVGERIYSTDPQMLLARGIDHNFVLDRQPGGGLSVAARLTDPKSGRQMEVRTTEPGVQIYTSNFMNGAALGANGRTLRQGDAIAFETQHFPDSPNKPSFPTTVLRPGETFRSTTEYAFSTDATPFPN
jgi:aldose 1-epimerase